MAPTFQWPFTDAQLTDRVNRLPRMWGRITQQGLFRFRAVATTMIRIQQRGGKLRILSAEERGVRGGQLTQTRAEEKILSIPHFPFDAGIGPEDIQDRIAWTPGTGMTAESLANLTQEKLAAIRRHFDITGEYLRMSALQGVLRDGSDEAGFDFFTFFGINQKMVDFDLGTAGTKVLEKCREVIAHVQDNILDDAYSGITAEVSEEFFDALIVHPSVEKYYIQHTAALTLPDASVDRQFRFGGILFREYRASAPDASGVTRRFIAANDGIAYPIGTSQTFAGVYGPAHALSQVNRPGQEIYITTELRRHEGGVDMQAQANMLPYCVRPEVLVRIHSST